MRKSPVWWNTGELETESEQARSEIATYLRDVADQLDAAGEVTLSLGGSTASVTPTDPITFKLEGESDWREADARAQRSIEFERVWWRDAETTDAGTLDVQQ